MSAKLNIDYDKKLAQFMIQCPFHANDLIRTLPVARWNKTRRAWAVPNVIRNIETIQTALRPYAVVTDAAEAAIEEAKGRANKAAVKSGFPDWFPMKTEPLPQQVEALHKLYGLEGCSIFMDPGLGKSKVVIDMNCCLFMEKKIDAWLVVCKLSLVENFMEQIEKHAAIPVSVHIPSTDRVKDYERWVKAPTDGLKCLIVGTESLSQGRMIEIAESFLSSFAKPAATVDESSMIATHNKIRSQRIVGFRVKVAYRQAMTGTPMTTSPLNLYMQYEFVDPDIIGIGDWYAFRNRYAVMGGYRDPKTGKPMQVVGYQNLEELAATVAPYTYEANKEILKLPPKRYEKRMLDFTAEQRELYRQIFRKKEYEVDGKTIVPKNVLEIILRLHEVCGGAIGWTEEEKQLDGRIKKKSFVRDVIPPKRNPKVIELMDVVEEIRGAGVVWTAYLHEIRYAEEALIERFGAEQVRTMTGKTTVAERQQLTRDFEAGKFQWLISNPQTGGMGFTWNAAEAHIYMSNTNKLVDRLQSEDRSHRIGQTKNIRIIDLVMRGTYDEAIIKTNELRFDIASVVRKMIAQNPDRALEALAAGRID